MQPPWRRRQRGQLLQRHHHGACPCPCPLCPRILVRRHARGRAPRCRRGHGGGCGCRRGLLLRLDLAGGRLGHQIDHCFSGGGGRVWARSVNIQQRPPPFLKAQRTLPTTDSTQRIQPPPLPKPAIRHTVNCAVVLPGPPYAARGGGRPRRLLPRLAVWGAAPTARERGDRVVRSHAPAHEPGLYGMDRVRSSAEGPQEPPRQPNDAKSTATVVDETSGSNVLARLTSAPSQHRSSSSRAHRQTWAADDEDVRRGALRLPLAIDAPRDRPTDSIPPMHHHTPQIHTGSLFEGREWGRPPRWTWTRAAAWRSPRSRACPSR